MDDDINTADALSDIYNLVKYANINVPDDAGAAFAGAVHDELAGLCDILGIFADVKEESLDEQVEAMIAERQAARKARDFAKADAIRDRLAAMGIELMDTKEGVKWKKKS